MNDMNDLPANWREKLDDLLPGGRTASVGITILAAYLLVCVVVGMYWSIAPAPFDVRAKAAAYAAEDGREVVTGSVTTAANARRNATAGFGLSC